MNILIVMPLAEQRGGGELMLLHLLQEGRTDGVVWSLVFLQNGPMVEQARGLGIEAHVVEMGRLRRLHRVAGAIRRIAAIARHARADVILGWMAMGQIYGGLAAQLAGLPAVWYQLGTARAGWGIDRAATCLPARGILTCSQDGADAQALLRPKRLLRVVYPGVDIDRFASGVLPCPTEARRLLGLPSEGPLIGIVGRLQHWKGMHVLVEALPAILRRCPDAHVVIVGGDHALEPDYPRFLRERIAALGMGGHITLAGLQHDVPHWVQAMDVFVHASDREPFGIVIIEAMALGKPVVAGDTGGPAEIITSGIDGLLSPYGDAEALARSVLRYLEEPGLAARLGTAAQTRAGAFSTPRYARNVIAATMELLNASGMSPTANG